MKRQATRARNQMANPLNHLFIITHSLVMDNDGVAELSKPRRFGRGKGQQRKGTKFRLLCDDRTIMAKGVTWDDEGEEEAFAPLDFGMNEWGATDIQLFEKGRWALL